MVSEVASKADMSPASFTMKIGEGAKDTILKFCGGTTEEAVRHVVKFWALEGKLEYQASYAAASKLLEGEKKKLSDESDKSKKTAIKANILELQREAKEHKTNFGCSGSKCWMPHSTLAGARSSRSSVRPTGT